LKKILIVDDEPDITFIWREALQEDSCLVDTFNDPLLALSNFKVNYYDLVLLDIRMPKMDGFELYQQLRKKDYNIKVCFVTAFEVYQDQFGQLSKYKLQRFIRKPIEIEELKRLVHNITQ
jgi:DNA-binding response OmpR family regulator